MSLLSVSFNRLFINFFFLILVIGVVFYDTIFVVFNFTYTDEILSMGLLFLIAISKKKNSEYFKEFLFFLMIALFYLVYSLFLGVNCYQAVLFDFIVQLKPYIGFYSVLIIVPRLSNTDKVRIKKLAILVSIYLLLIVSFGRIEDILFHASKLAVISVIMGILYLYSSSQLKQSRLVSLLIVLVGLFSFKAKAYGFIVVWGYLLYFFNSQVLKLSLVKKFLVISVITFFSILVSFEKFNMYFIEGITSLDLDSVNTSEVFARPALFLVVPQIIVDYFPFGSGLGSFATWASGVYYSPLYFKYDLDSVWGLNDDFFQFVGDTFFPQMAQFGICGIILFVWFWIRIYKKIVSNYYITSNLTNLIVGLSIMAFFIIESFADSTFIHNRGMVMMMILAFAINDKQTFITPNENTNISSKS